MTIPEVPQQAPEPAAPTAAPQRRAGGNGLLVALSILCAVLLLATLGFGTGAAILSVTNDSAAADPGSTPTPKPTAKVDRDRTVHGIPVDVVSDIDFGYFFMTNTDAKGFTSLYSQIRNDDETRAVSVFFDVSLYDEDAVLLSRWPSSVYMLPGQVTLFTGVTVGNMLDVASIRIEQTSLSREEPRSTGTVVLDEARSGDNGLVGGKYTSTLGVEGRAAHVYLVAAVDNEVLGVCWDYENIPASGAFDFRCTLDPASRDEPEPITTLPDDAVVASYYTLDTIQ